MDTCQNQIVRSDGPRPMWVYPFFRHLMTWIWTIGSWHRNATGRDEPSRSSQQPLGNPLWHGICRLKPAWWTTSLVLRSKEARGHSWLTYTVHMNDSSMRNGSPWPFALSSLLTCDNRKDAQLFPWMSLSPDCICERTGDVIDAVLVLRTSNVRSGHHLISTGRQLPVRRGFGPYWI